MKPLFFTISLLLFTAALPAFSQPLSWCIDPGKNTLLHGRLNNFHPDSRDQNPWNLYVEGGFSLLSLASKAEPGVQIGGGLVYKQKFSAGGFLGTSFSRFTSAEDTSASLAYNFQYLGGELQYTLNPDDLVSISFPMQLAIGILRQHVVDDNGDVVQTNGRDGLGMIIPGVKVDVNLTHKLRLGLTVNYKGALRTTYLPDSEISGLNALLLLRYHLF